MKVAEKEENGKRLNKLREITEQLPLFPPEIGQHFPGMKEYAIDCGTSMSWNLLSQKEVSCARWFASSGSDFPEHVHKEREFVIVYKGSVFITEKGKKERKLSVGDSIIIEPGVLHSARTLEDCWFIAVSIPKSKTWPE